MRQLYVHVPREAADRVLEIAERRDAPLPLVLDARRGAEEWALLTLNPPNHQVGRIIAEIGEAVERAEFILSPHEVLPLATPLDEVDEAVRQVPPLSTMEIVLASLQSIGAWKGMLLYALLSGIIAAYAAIMDITYLLVGAMLVAPMGAPVMVSVVGASIGDWRMAAKGLQRFAASILVLVAAAALLGWLYGLSFSTATMEQTTSLSHWGVLLALAAGAAGALSQVQSDRSSLVSGTAMGFLVAGAMSPTSAVLGLALVIRRWDYVAQMAFQLAVQFAAIVLGGWLVALLFGLRPRDPALGHGSSRWRAPLVATLALATLLLVGWQQSQNVRFHKADASRDLIALSTRAIRGVPGARVVDSSARFTRPVLSRGPRETALLELVVERGPRAAPPAALEAEVTRVVRDAVRRQMPDVVPYLRVTILPRPPELARP